MSAPPPPHPPVGLVLSPFRGWRYDEAVVGDLGAVLSPPNDVLTDGDLRDLEARSPWNACHLSRPPSYAAAALTLVSWIGSGALRQDTAPGLYAYEQVLPDGRAVRGLMGALGLRPPAAGIVLPHEDTRPGPIADRLALMSQTGADLEPILVLYDGGELVAAALNTALTGHLLADAVTPDGVRHRLAAVTDPAVLTALAGDLLPRRALIADGHHRYVTYLQRRRERRSGGAGPGPWDYGLALLVDAAQDGLQVRPIHRVLEHLPLDAALAGVSAVARVTDLTQLALGGGRSGAHNWLAALADAARPAGSLVPRTAFVFAAGQRAYLVEDFDAAAVAAAVGVGGGAALRGLAVTAMARYLLPRVLLHRETDGVDVPEADRAAALAERAGGTAILLPPITFREVLRVAGEGDRMPRKSTLFSPKPASGLALRMVDPASRHLGTAGEAAGHLVSDVSSTS